MTEEYIEVSANNSEAAIAQALEKLGAERDDCDIVVIDEGAKGFLGLGSRNAVVRVTLKDSPERRAISFLTNVTKKMGMDATIEAKDSEDALNVTIAGENMGSLIGHHGETLDALQYLTGLCVNRNNDSYHRVLLDTEGYREKRADTLRQLAERAAARAVKIGRVAMEPMNPYERRILHTTLQDNARVTTYSEGAEPYRRVIIVRK